MNKEMNEDIVKAATHVISNTEYIGTHFKVSRDSDRCQSATTLSLKDISKLNHNRVYKNHKKELRLWVGEVSELNYDYMCAMQALLRHFKSYGVQFNLEEALEKVQYGRGGWYALGKIAQFKKHMVV